ncbi:uncharacterized protein LOC108906642 [Anoplophora glabripennis]|uniref:uncharacterized protein LOC108906642 n=1 Tax=Anoplophora glabripennis TaxID=217634 RepID=UPI000873E884|nr:uncharacterized protein LOC108906642 [Anoplophora glabripennis]
MKLFLVVCAFAVVSAEYITPTYQGSAVVHGSPVAPGSSYVTQAYYHGGASSNYVQPVYQPQVQNGPQHVPVIKNGVPVDTPEVQQARAEHFALYAKAAAAAEAAKATTGQKQYDDGSYYQQSQTYYPTATNQYSQAHGGSSSGSSYIYQSGGHLSNSGPYQAGPVDTADVQQAKAAHFTALQRAAVRAASTEHHRYRRSAVWGAQLQHVPVITKDGVPQETPEVQVAKAQHLIAHANAKAGHSEWSQASAGNYGDSSSIWTNYETPEVNKVQYSVNHDFYGGWTGPQHYPQIDKDGVPVETPEVQIAKQQHFLAHSQAKLGLYSQVQAGSYYGSSFPHANITPDGVPEETPEVKIAKARHFAAHAEEQAKHAKWAGQTGSGYGSGFGW